MCWFYTNSPFPLFGHALVYLFLDSIAIMVHDNACLSLPYDQYLNILMLYLCQKIQKANVHFSTLNSFQIANQYPITLIQYNISQHVLYYWPTMVNVSVHGVSPVISGRYRHHMVVDDTWWGCGNYSVADKRIRRIAYSICYLWHHQQTT